MASPEMLNRAEIFRIWYYQWSVQWKFGKFLLVVVRINNVRYPRVMAHISLWDFVVWSCIHAQQVHSVSNIHNIISKTMVTIKIALHVWNHAEINKTCQLETIFSDLYAEQKCSRGSSQSTISRNWSL